MLRERPYLGIDMYSLVWDFDSMSEKDNDILSLFNDKLYKEGVECSEEIAFIIGYMLIIKEIT